MAQLQKAPQGMWFYKDEERREFREMVALGCNDTEYSLCTDAEKEEWINSHKADYPELFEVEDNEQATKENISN